MPQDHVDQSLLQSDFLVELRKQFFNSLDRPIWPGGNRPATRLDRAKSQMPPALKALIQSSTKLTPPPSGPAGSALARVKKAATNSGWPGPTSKVPTEWIGDMARFRHFEAAWAISIMMEAFARSGGGGGGPREWPTGSSP